MKIINFSKSITNKSYLTISVLGTALKLNLQYSNTSKTIELIKKETEIDLILPHIYKHLDNIEIINSAVGKLYMQLANTELEYSLELARHIFKFAPDDYKIERLNDAFYKCSKKVLIINPDIMQYNKDIINSTILQAFCKMKFKVNSKEYKNALESALLKYDKYKNQRIIEEKISKVG